MNFDARRTSLCGVASAMYLFDSESLSKKFDHRRTPADATFDKIPLVKPSRI